MTTVSMNGVSLQNPAAINSAVKVGSRGSFVEQLQKTLVETGYNASSNVDGIFGPRTLEAVQAYQLSNNISSPRGNYYGVAGPQTLGSLGLAATNDSSSEPRTPGHADRLITSAKRHIGTPYQWGGTTSTGFDCSGFIQNVFSENGKQLPRTTSQLWDAGTNVASPSKGDLVFFETRTGASHVGMYVGNNKFIHSGSSTGVTITDMDNTYWKSKYLGAKQV
ncbi:NlpC/P60 family protein [Alteribacillus sp. HJP-4]|uniref:C40 family peptidase n=1 Tax=Alteribacillus sp. HJP-4 TaxID=2775394 RepID=UPI0035CD13A2